MYTVTYNIGTMPKRSIDFGNQNDAVDFFARRSFEARKLGGRVVFSRGTTELLLVSY